MSHKNDLLSNNQSLNDLNNKNIDGYIEDHLLDNLYDIEDLFEISIWPLAIGWWLLIGIVICVVAILIGYYLRNRKLKKTWQYKLKNELLSMKSNISNDNFYKDLIRISEILRIIACKRYLKKNNFNKDATNNIVGLYGNLWIDWLNANAPEGFDWKDNSKMVNEIPYMSESSIKKIDINLSKLQNLINITIRWIDLKKVDKKNKNKDL